MLCVSVSCLVMNSLRSHRLQPTRFPQTVAHQVPLSMGFSRQEYWSGLPFPFPGDLPDPGIKPGSPTLQADSLPSELSFIELLLCAKLYIYVIFHLTIHMTISKMRTQKRRNSADVIKVIYLRGQAGIQAQLFLPSTIARIIILKQFNLVLQVYHSLSMKMDVVPNRSCEVMQVYTSNPATSFYSFIFIYF